MDNSFKTNALYRTKLCIYHSTGNCKRGASCLHAHSLEDIRPLPDFRKTKLCRYFTKGLCTNENCSRAHGEQELRRVEQFYKKKLCMYWTENGSCIRGNECYFAHIDAEVTNGAGLGFESFLDTTNSFGSQVQMAAIAHPSTMNVPGTQPQIQPIALAQQVEQFGREYSDTITHLASVNRNNSQIDALAMQWLQVAIALNKATEAAVSLDLVSATWLSQQQPQCAPQLPFEDETFRRVQMLELEKVALLKEKLLRYFDDSTKLQLINSISAISSGSCVSNLAKLGLFPSESVSFSSDESSTVSTASSMIVPATRTVSVANQKSLLFQSPQVFFYRAAAEET